MDNKITAFTVRKAQNGWIVMSTMQAEKVGFDHPSFTQQTRLFETSDTLLSFIADHSDKLVTEFVTEYTEDNENW